METGHPTQMGELPERFDSPHFALYTQRMIERQGKFWEIFMNQLMYCVYKQPQVRTTDKKVLITFLG